MVISSDAVSPTPSLYLPEPGVTFIVNTEAVYDENDAKVITGYKTTEAASKIFANFAIGNQVIVNISDSTFTLPHMVFSVVAISQDENIYFAIPLEEYFSQIEIQDDNYLHFVLINSIREGGIK